MIIQYERITTLSVVISGSSSSDCEILAALQEASLNMTFTLSQRAQILQLKQKLELFFSNTTDLAVRLEYISATCHQMFLVGTYIMLLLTD